MDFSESPNELLIFVQELNDLHPEGLYRVMFHHIIEERMYY